MVSRCRAGELVFVSGPHVPLRAVQQSRAERPDTAQDESDGAGRRPRAGWAA